eukprot:4004218-Amphidinium_carterae.1
MVHGIGSDDDPNHRSTETTFCTMEKSKSIKKQANQRQYINHTNHHQKWQPTLQQCLLCVRTTGLGYATIVQTKGEVYHAIPAIKTFIVENGLQTTILQSDSEASIIEFLKKVTRQISHLRCQHVPHQSLQNSVLQGLQHRQYQRQFTQLTTQSHGTSQHSAWLLNRFLRHADGKTSYEINWKR